jgi:hypothetical protein
LAWFELEMKTSNLCLKQPSGFENESHLILKMSLETNRTNLRLWRGKVFGEK